MNESLKTPLNLWHRDQGANMAAFGGYDMPLWYPTSVKTEHLAVLAGAGIFDTSHMACILVKGKSALATLNYCFTRDISSLITERCVYGAFLDQQGHCIDDAIVYRLDSDRFMICVNAGMGATVTDHIAAHAPEDLSITDLSGKVAKVDVQGKNSARILSCILKDPEAVFSGMPYFSFKGDVEDPAPGRSPVTLLDGTPVLISRSGYTGEFGFEIFVSPNQVVSLWETLLEKGKPFSLLPCGLGARDSLRAGACLPLSHQDIGHFAFINHPWDFALPFTPDNTGFTKEFIGADALLNLASPRFTYAFAGDSLRKVNAGDLARVHDDSGKDIGHVLTCATDMGISWYNGAIISVNTPDLPPDIKIKGLSCGFVMVDQALASGTRLTLKEGRRAIEVTTMDDIRPDRTARLALKHFI